LLQIFAAIVTVKPGGIRELHWHPNADEWQYLAVKGPYDGLATGGRARTMDFASGDVGYVQRHCHITSKCRHNGLEVPEMFKSSQYQIFPPNGSRTHRQSRGRSFGERQH
jgi:oxalate decarboxylase